MVIENTTSYHDTKLRLHDLVTFSKISSIELISEQIGIDEETIKEFLQDLVDEGSIIGTLTEDGKRFYLSDVKISTAPIVTHEEYATKPQVKTTKHAKVISLTGIVMMVLGSILRSFVAIDIRFDNVGTAVFMLGIVVLVVGWMLISRANPPQKI